MAVAELYQSRRRWQAQDRQYDAWVSTCTVIANGELDGPTTHIATLNGRASH